MNYQRNSKKLKLSKKKVLGKKNYIYTYIYIYIYYILYIQMIRDIVTDKGIQYTVQRKDIEYW